MDGRLKERVAVVTGSGQGIGRAIALAFAREGAKVVSNNRRPGTPGGDAATTADAIREMGGEAVPFFGDTSNFETARELMQSAKDNYGRVDILVNNAGGIATNMVWNIPEAEWDEVINSSLKSSFNCIRHSAKLMIEQRWGRIINTTSFIWLGTTERAHYVAAKAGIVGLTWAVARETGKYGVTCNAYAPVSGTRMTVNPAQLAAYKRKYEAGVYTKQQYEGMLNPPRPESVTPLLAYLCTDAAANINGQIFDVWGNDISMYSTPTKAKTISKKEGLWNIDELADMVPDVLLDGYRNPAPVEAGK